MQAKTDVSSAPHASESEHWYWPDGRPAYTIVGANGNERATTLRDARKHGFIPSVTTIMQAAAKPNLERWKGQQLLLAALTLPRNADESEESWVARVWEDSKQQAQKAAVRGSAIHGAIEAHYLGQPYDATLAPWVRAVQDCVQDVWGAPEWSPEKSFAHVLGYGGKVDLHSRHAWSTQPATIENPLGISNGGIVVDFKTKDGDVGTVKTYDDHAMQLAAYRRGLGMDFAQCGIVFISRDKPQAEARLISEEELVRGWAQFSALLDYWYATTGLGR